MNTQEKFRRPRSEFEDTPLDRIIAIGVFLILVACILLGFWYGRKTLIAGISYAEERRATAECEKWADEAKVYPGYFLVEWQKMQCDTYGVSVDAPVKNYSKEN